MFKSLKSCWLVLAIAVLAVAGAVCLLLIKPAQSCALDVSVVNAYTLTPIEGAAVVVPEQEITAVSGKNGHAIINGIKLVKDAEHELLLGQSWGEVTLLAYKQGYLPFVLLYTHVSSERVLTPTIYMFPLNEEGAEVISMVESPNEQWLKELLEKYKPESVG